MPDMAKIKDITNMPTPHNKQELQKFIGVAAFLSNHVANFSAHTAILRDLLKAEAPFIWEADDQQVYQKVKDPIAAQTKLQYYNPASPVDLEVDASLKGLGTTLVQASGPVAFASKALTSAETNYSNIKRECFAIVHGVQCFHHYLYGRCFRIITDHKPLEMILNKLIHAAPPRLQHMMLKLRGYNFTIVYRPGSDMISADTLSWPSKHKEKQWNRAGQQSGHHPHQGHFQHCYC